MRVLISVVLILTLLSACKAGSDPVEKSAASAPDYSTEEDRSMELEEGLNRKEAKKDSKAESIDSHFIMPFSEAKGRKLEYSINLSYESRNVLGSRETLLQIIGRYGFVISSNTSTYERSPSMNVSFKVKTDSVYRVLSELKRVGALKQESITVNDLTADNYYSLLQEKREQTRILRRAKALQQYNLVQKDFVTREGQLAESENSLDEAEFEQWKIEDKVNWTNMHVAVHGPRLPDIVVVPQFQNALVALANGLLDTIYVLIKFLPFVIILGLIIWKREAILILLQIKKKKDKAEDSND